MGILGLAQGEHLIQVTVLIPFVGQAGEKIKGVMNRIDTQFREMPKKTCCEAFR